jgi:hypothetical protein
MINIPQAINTLRVRLSRSNSLALAARRARAIPLSLWLAAAALIFAGLWLHEHDARVCAAAELQQVKQQTTQQVVALQSQANAALRAANQQNAAAIAGLEAQRHTLAQRADQLAAQLESLRQEKQERAEGIAALPPGELAQQLTKQLGPEAVARSASQPQAGSSQAQPQGSAAETTPLLRQTGQLALSTEGQRKVAVALDDLDSCRAESALQETRLSNCRQQISAADAEIRTQADSLAKLNQALRAKDGILAARESEFKTELAAARGTWRSRTMRALKLMAVGVGIGLAIK